jgi:hypothetical protein
LKICSLMKEEVKEVLKEEVMKEEAKEEGIIIKK